MVKFISQYIIVFSFVWLSSCTKVDPISPPPLPRPPSVAGEWNDPNIPLSVNLVESDATITGSGNVAGGYPISVSGKNRYPNITFSIGTLGYAPATFTGQFVSKDTIQGELTGNIYYGAATVLVRR